VCYLRSSREGGITDILMKEREFNLPNGGKAKAVSLYDLPEHERLNAKTLRQKKKNRAKKKRNKR